MNRPAAEQKVWSGVKRKRASDDHAVATAVRNGHWTVEVTRSKPALVAEMLKPCHIIVQNHGPGLVKLVASGPHRSFAWRLARHLRKGPSQN
jgi:hypothetical protein